MSEQQSIINENSPLNSIENDRNITSEMFNLSIVPKKHHHHHQGKVNQKKIRLLPILFWSGFIILVVVGGFYIYENYFLEGKIFGAIKQIKNGGQRNKGYGVNKQSKVDGLYQMQAQGNSIVEGQQVDLPLPQILKIQYKQIQLKTLQLGQIPHRAWYFSDKNIKNSTLWTQKCFQTYQNITKKMNYDFISFSITDYSKYIPQDRYQFIQQQILSLNNRYKSGLQPQIIRYKDLIIRQLIILEVLIENGGIYIDEDIILTEDFKWIREIDQNVYVNARGWISKAEIVGFYDGEISSELKSYKEIQSIVQTDNFAVKNPSISSYFIAAVKNCTFLKDLRNQYYKILEYKQKIKSQVKKIKLSVNFQQKNINFYKNLFQISSQITLHKKDTQLAQKNISSLKFYKLASINENYGPKKLQTFMRNWQKNKIFNHLSKIHNSQLEYLYGKMRYMIKLQPKQDYQNLLLQQINKQTIISGSLIHQTILQSTSLPFIQQIPQQKTMKLQTWNTLPNKIWTYNNKTLFQSNLIHQIWLQHLQIVCNSSDFQLVILNQQNLHNYLDKDTLIKIQKAITTKNQKLKLSQETKVEMISLAILYQYGGIWIQSQTFFIGTLQWLKNINRQKYIWNKSGTFPKVILSFHPGYGPPLQWKYNQQGIKELYQLGYQKNFIAAQSKAEFIKDWLNQYIANVGLSFDELVNKFFGAKMRFKRWISDKNHEKLFLDSINSVLGLKKQLFINDQNMTSPTEYYGLWAINGFSSYLKMREYSNFNQPKKMENSYVWRYRMKEFQDIGGEVHYFTKIYPSTVQRIEKIMKENIKNPQKQFNENSYFMTLLNSINEKIILQKDRLFLQKVYIEHEQKIQGLSQINKILWVYQQQNEEKDILTKQIYSNLQFYALKSSFNVRYINLLNYKTELLQNTAEEISLFLQQLQKRVKLQKSNLKDHYENIIEQILVLSLLQDHGGIAISKRLILHQDFNWIKTINMQNFTNKIGNYKPKVFAFHSPGYSPKKTSNQKNQQYIQFPSIQSYFIAAGSQSIFIKDMLQEFKKIILSHENIKKQIKALKHPTGWLEGNDPYYEAFFIASQFTLTKRQNQLRGKNIQRSAIDFYGLVTMNSRFFVSKLNNFVSMLQISDEIIDETLGRSSLSELESYIGPLKYASILPNTNTIKRYIQNHVDNKIGYEIVQKSFVYQYLIKKLKTKTIVKYQYQTKSNKTQWQNLPQLVWIVSNKQNSLINQIISQHLSKSFRKVGYKVNKIDDNNIKEYLPKQILQKIKTILKENNNIIHKQYLYKLFLLYQYGGITVNLNLIAIQDVSWIKNINNLQNQLIFNKFTENPKALMFADHLRFGNNKWNHSLVLKTKIGHKLGWNDDFIAVEKNSLFIKQWLQNFMNLLQKDQPSKVKLMQQCQIKQSRFVKQKKPNLLRLDSLQCLLNLKSLQLQRQKSLQLQRQKAKKQVCIHYGLWGISDYIGPAKLEDQLSVDRVEHDLNPFLWIWQQEKVEKIVGKVRFMARLAEKQSSLVEELIKVEKMKQWGEDGSILKQAMWESVYEKLEINEAKLRVKK